MRCPGRFLTVVSTLVVLALVAVSARGQEVDVQKAPDTLLYIRTVPSGAKILVDGEAKGTSDQLIELPNGTERVVVEVQWDGQPGERREIVVRSGRVTRVEFTGKRPSEAGAPDRKRPRKYVRLVVGRGSMTFEGRETTWEELPGLLEQVPDRKHTVLEIAFTSGDVPQEQYDKDVARGISLAAEMGFEYSSQIGVHPLGSKGMAPWAFVRLVVGSDSMTFEGKETTWKGLPNLLSSVPNRTDTVLEIAFTSDDLPKEQRHDAVVKGIAVAAKLQFKYLSQIGIHPLGSKGTRVPADSSDEPAAEGAPAETPKP